MKLDITNYSVSAPVSRSLTAAVMSDIHGEVFDYILERVVERRPDLIFVPGDIVNRHDADPGNGESFLCEAGKIAPVFMSLGNHERNARDSVRRSAERTGTILLEEKSVRFDGLNIGGLTSGYVFQEGRLRQGHLRRTPEPKIEWLIDYSMQSGFKVLLSHHPEYYSRYERDLDIDLILSGHAHGGQWRPFGVPLFAPDQALFPKYAQGIHDGRLIVSRGLANNAPVPRFWNHRELIFINFRPLYEELQKDDSGGSVKGYGNNV